MPNDYTPPNNNTYHATIQLPDDGDDADAASVNTPLEAAQDSIAYLKQHKANMDVGNNTISVPTEVTSVLTSSGVLELLATFVLNPTTLSPSTVSQFLTAAGPLYLLSEPTGGTAHFLKLPMSPAPRDGELRILAFTTLQVGTHAGPHYEVFEDAVGAVSLFEFDDRGVDIAPADPITDSQNIPVGTGAIFRYSTDDNHWHYIGGWGYVRPL